MQNVQFYSCARPIYIGVDSLPPSGHLPHLIAQCLKIAWVAAYVKKVYSCIYVLGQFRNTGIDLLLQMATYFI